MNRRNLLKAAGGLVLAGATSAIAPRAFATTASDVRQLSFVNTHTGDTFRAAYWEQGNYIPGALQALKHVLRDHRTNEVHDIDPRLFDQLHQLNSLIGASQPYQIISGYRSPTTNAMLHANSDGVATYSLHMEGRAMDIRVTGVDLSYLRDAALSLHAGGVGYYPSAGSDFVHVDTGRVRRW